MGRLSPGVELWVSGTWDKPGIGWYKWIWTLANGDAPQGAPPWLVFDIIMDPTGWVKLLGARPRLHKPWCTRPAR